MAAYIRRARALLRPKVMSLHYLQGSEQQRKYNFVQTQVMKCYGVGQRPHHRGSPQTMLQGLFPVVLILQQHLVKFQNYSFPVDEIQPVPICGYWLRQLIGCMDFHGIS